MNCGIQDADYLAWKLAAVLRGSEVPKRKCRPSSRGTPAATTRSSSP
ncbi:FAD-dependent monooxygenase [Nonomuraea sp. NPDC059194]